MKTRFGVVVIGSIALLAMLSLAMFRSDKKDATTPGMTLRIHCAAGISVPMQEIMEQYANEYGVQFETNFQGSGQLLTSLRLDKEEGDLYLAADVSYMDEAKKLSLIDEVAPIAWQSPCIAVRKGVSVSSLEDLLADDIKISLADPKVAAISRVAKKMLENAKTSDRWAALFQKATVTRSTVNEVANDIKSGAVQAGIVWDATAAQYDELEIVRVPEFPPAQKQISLAVLRSTSDPTQTLHFLRYVTSRDRGLPVFAKHGYQTVKGDAWSEHPELTLFTGGLMHPAIQETIDNFEEREGVSVSQVPNGCGVLVASIRSGQHPDAYFACDTSFMDMVSDLFPQPQDVSGTEMVLITKRGGNYESLTNVDELANSNLRLGLCNPEHSALGDLSKRLLEARGQWQPIIDKELVVDWPSTADRLVESVVLGAMDAAIVYRANTTRQADKLNVNSIDDPAAHAIQPIAVGVDSNYPLLMARFVDAIRSADSRTRFEDLGFEWLGN
ncbi:MAG: substrate-binding domain-containing protein [Planctomycetales bacterium]|nr:substrate-binding domain-containing protein [Planctomycetales bacterium]